MRKGQISFLLKSLTLVAAIIAFAIVVFLFQGFTKRTIGQKRSSRLRMSAQNTLQELITSEDCLAASFEGTPQKGVIDLKKLESFSSKYQNIEPECARKTSFDYQVQIKTLHTNVTTYEKRSLMGGVVGDMMPLIQGRRAVFVVDWSASMTGTAVPGETTPKIECAGIFLQGFIENLNKSSNITIDTFPKPTDFGHGRCAIKEKLVGPVLLNTTAKRDQANETVEKYAVTGQTHCCTPMAEGLDAAFSYAETNGIDTIVLLGDGKQCCGSCRPDGSTVDVAENNAGLNIPVHTIAFGQSPATSILSQVSDKTGGTYFRARSCEKLLGAGKTLNREIQSENWGFGVSEFSSGQAKKEEITVSMPVSVRYGEGDVKRALVKLKVVKGSLETLGSTINSICRSASSSSKDIQTSLNLYLQSPVDYDPASSELCMKGQDKICKKISCSVPLTFEEVEVEGNYNILMTYDSSSDQIKVDT